VATNYGYTDYGYIDYGYTDYGSACVHTWLLKVYDAERPA